MNVRKKTIIITLILLLVLMLLCGCHSRVKLPNGSVSFVDAKSGRSVASVLLIPNYSTFSGITTGMGHGPGRGRSGTLLAHPFIYYSDGAPFKVKQPLSIGIIIPFLWIGIIHKAIGLEGIDAYAKGYKVRYIEFYLLNKPRPSTFKLESLDEVESKKDFARISEGLRNRNFEVLLTYPSMPDEVLEFDFSRKQLKMMQDFFTADAKTE